MRPKRVRTARLFPSLDRTPFVAVTAILFALLLFAVALMIQQPGFRGLDLPKVNYPMYMPDAGREDALVISVFRDGRIYFGQDAIPVGALATKLRERLSVTPYTPTYLNVDAHTSYKSLSKVLDAVRAAGVENVGFLAQQRKPLMLIADNSPPFWDLGRLRWSLRWLGLANFMLLAILLANTGSIVCWRLYSYIATQHQTRAFIRDAGPTLRDGKFDEVIRVAERNSRSQVARLLAEGLAAFASMPPEFTDTEAVVAAQRTFQRSRNVLTARMRVGLNSLATTASCAPFIGFLGTVFGIIGAFRETGTERSTALAWVASNIADAIMLGAMGLLVAVSAAWSLNYLRNRLAALENEISNAQLEFVSCLKTHAQWREQSQHSPVSGGIIAWADTSTARRWEIPYDRLRVQFLVMWCCALYAMCLLAGGIYGWWLYR